MKLETIKEEYLNYSKHFKSNGTYRYDKSHLSIIVQFLVKQGIANSTEVDFNDLYAFIDYSRENDNSNKTINKRIALLNRAITFQVEQNKCNPSIIASFPKLKELDKRFDVIDEKTMRRIIKHMLNKDNRFINKRDKALIFLFIDTGARLSEVSKIKISNVDLENNTILLDHTKTKRERIIYFTDFTSNYLKNYIYHIDDSNQYLFRNSRNNEPLKYLGIIRVFHKIRDELGLEKLSSHMIRHSYGTLAYKKDMPSLFTKNSMGHSRIEMTERYTHYDIKTNSRIYKKLSPMEHYISKKDR
ncbi:MAG: tyrosine-type recombinase/integrase [Candidatus Izimaplasma sp.]|nr:tyrosine-type recombinase/integrase [Candidatus Izimaplasma bacterium]